MIVTATRGKRSIELNSSGRCVGPNGCGGEIHNIPGRRMSREQLMDRHADVCPGIWRRAD